MTAIECPSDGLRAGGIVLRLPAAEDVSIAARASADEDIIGNVESERVLERARFTREGLLRSMPRGGRERVDQTLFSLLRDA